MRQKRDRRKPAVTFHPCGALGVSMLKENSTIISESYVLQDRTEFITLSTIIKPWYLFCFNLPSLVSNFNFLRAHVLFICIVTCYITTHYLLAREQKHRQKIDTNFVKFKLNC